MTTDDPRIEAAQTAERRNEHYLWARRFDRADRAAGVVRVDTRNPATAMVERATDALLDALPHDGVEGHQDGEIIARAVLAALAAPKDTP